MALNVPPGRFLPTGHARPGGRPSRVLTPFVILVPPGAPDPHSVDHSDAEPRAMVRGSDMGSPKDLHAPVTLVQDGKRPAFPVTLVPQGEADAALTRLRAGRGRREGYRSGKFRHQEYRSR